LKAFFKSNGLVFYFHFGLVNVPVSKALEPGAAAPRKSRKVAFTIIM
jgi:hypothetical protein